MATIEQYKHHYRPAVEGPKSIFCMDDRPTEDENIGPASVQTAGSALGLGFDLGFMRTATERDGLLYIPLYALRVVRMLGKSATALQHVGCKGELEMPNVPTIVTASDQQTMYVGLQQLGLGLGDRPIGKAFETFAAYAPHKYLVPRAELAASTLESGYDGISLGRVGLAGDHMSGVILSDLTGDTFDTRDAWAAGNPAYNISFGSFGPLAAEAYGGIDKESEEVLLAVSGLRHLATAQSLSHPNPDESMKIIVHGS